MMRKSIFFEKCIQMKLKQLAEYENNCEVIIIYKS